MCEPTGIGRRGGSEAVPRMHDSLAELHRRALPPPHHALTHPHIDDLTVIEISKLENILKAATVNLEKSKKRY